MSMEDSTTTTKRQRSSEPVVVVGGAGSKENANNYEDRDCVVEALEQQLRECRQQLSLARRQAANSQQTLQHARATQKQFIIDTLMDAQNEGDNWNRLSEYWQQDRDVALAAIQSGSLTGDIPATFTHDRPFWLQAVALDADLYLKDLPKQFANDIEFARELEVLDQVIVNTLFDRFPMLSHEFSVWKKLIDSHEFAILHETIQTYAPYEIRSNRDLMLPACLASMETLASIKGNILRDGDFLRTVLDKYPCGLRYVQRESQLLFPELVVAKLPVLGQMWASTPMFVDHLGTNLAPELWHNRQVIAAWFTSGFFFLHDQMPAALSRDPQVLYWLARHCPLSRRCRGTFERAPATLLANKAFVMEAVGTRNAASVLSAAPLHMKRDLDVGVMYFSVVSGESENDMFDYVDAVHTGRVGTEPTTRILRYVKKRLSDRDAFFLFLCGITKSSSESPVSVLNQGNETIHCYKQRIAEFVGLPVRDELRRLRLAQASITRGNEGRWEEPLDI